MSDDPAEMNRSGFTLANLAPGLGRPRNLPTDVRTSRLPASQVTLHVQGFPPCRIPSSAPSGRVRTRERNRVADSPQIPFGIVPPPISSPESSDGMD